MTLPKNMTILPSSHDGGDEDRFRFRLVIKHPKNGTIFSYAEDHAREEHLGELLTDAITVARDAVCWFPFESYPEWQQPIFAELFRRRHMGWGEWDEIGDD